MHRWSAVVTMLALAACKGDFEGSVCTDCRPIDAAPGDASAPDAAPDVCAGVSCDEPPANGCDGDLVTVYPASGTCDPATGDCVYEPTRTACDQPPADECADTTRIDYPDTGSCAPAGGNPRCVYNATETDCAAGDEQCVAGDCVDPCQPNPCDQPPPARCTGPNLHTFASPGACTSPAGVVQCEYVETVTNCSSAGQVCDAEAGACVDP